MILAEEEILAPSEAVVLATLVMKATQAISQSFKQPRLQESDIGLQSNASEFAMGQEFIWHSLVRDLFLELILTNKDGTYNGNHTEHLSLGNCVLYD